MEVSWIAHKHISRAPPAMNVCRRLVNIHWRHKTALTIGCCRITVLFILGEVIESWQGLTLLKRLLNFQCQGWLLQQQAGLPHHSERLTTIYFELLSDIARLLTSNNQICPYVFPQSQPSLFPKRCKYCYQLGTHHATLHHQSKTYVKVVLVMGPAFSMYYGSVLSTVPTYISGVLVL